MPGFVHGFSGVKELIRIGKIISVRNSAGGKLSQEFLLINRGKGPCRKALCAGQLESS